MKKKVMLIVPMLHQGGFERVCVATARLLEPFYEVYIVIFSARYIAYDIRGLHVIDLHMGAAEGKLLKIRNVFRRSRRVSALKKDLGIDIAYSFGPTANLVNVFSRSRGKTWCGVRSYMDMENPRTTSTLYNPFDIKEEEERAQEEESRLPFQDCGPVVVSMGREDDVKGFWHLVKSFSLVHRRLPDSRLVIVGEGDFLEYWKLAEALGISDAVSFPGVKKNPFPWLKLGSIYVMTSLNEGFPNVLVEAMALGKPVISTNCMTGPAEILMDDFEAYVGKEEYVDGDYGILIPNLETQKNLDARVITQEEELLAEQMLRLLTDQKLHKKYADAALKRAACFSNEAYVEQLRGMAEDV